MTDARKTPREIRAENRKSWRDDIGTMGKVIGVVLGTVALLGMCGATYLKWSSVVTKDEATTMHAEIEEHSVARDKKQGEEITAIQKEVQTTGHNVRVLLCRELAKNKREREKCAFTE